MGDMREPMKAADPASRATVIAPRHQLADPMSRPRSTTRSPSPERSRARERSRADAVGLSREGARPKDATAPAEGRATALPSTAPSIARRTGWNKHQHPPRTPLSRLTLRGRKRQQL